MILFHTKEDKLNTNGRNKTKAKTTKELFRNNSKLKAEIDIITH